MPAIYTRVEKKTSETKKFGEFMTKLIKTIIIYWPAILMQELVS